MLNVVNVNILTSDIAFLLFRGSNFNKRLHCYVISVMLDSYTVNLSVISHLNISDEDKCIYPNVSY